MGLNIKNEEVERLASEVAKKFGESKTEAIRVALKERLERDSRWVSPEEKNRRLLHTLETKIWPKMPLGQLGKTLTKEEEDEIIGYGPNGV